ncbi:hypothetical protein, partial [[Clostridium] symbiosum]|uniref:hypothetical protein n=1 Tax=Clostridium symbiosum TaxID=1512 RepID=UPI00319E6888
CILLQRKECWKCAFQHTPTFSIEPKKSSLQNKRREKERCSGEEALLFSVKSLTGSAAAGRV